MNLTEPFDGAAHPFVRLLLSERLPGHSVDGTIHPGDEMLTEVLREHNWDFALTSYFDRGLQAFEAYVRLGRAFRRELDDDVLDFAAGFGRVTRYLASFHGPERVTAADVQPAAVEFLARQFGVRSIASPIRAADFEPGRTFGIVVAFSFFSHMPEAAFREWLERLYGLLKPGGLLVFSVHDESLAPAAELDPAGILFRPVSETDRLESEQYGSTWVSAEFVRGAVEGACRGASLLRWPRGLANYQDIYIVSDRALDERVSIPLDQGPFGFFSITRLRRDQLELYGWAAHKNPERAVASIVVSINAMPVAQTTSFLPRPDVVAHTGERRHLNSGWMCRVQLPASCSMATDVLSIKARSDTDAETLLFIGTIETALLASCRAELTSAGREAVVFPLEDDEERPFGLQAALEGAGRTVEKADAQAREIFAIEANSPHGHRIVGLIAFWRGDLAGSIAAFSRALRSDPGNREFVAMLTFLSAAGGQTDRARLWVRQLEPIDRPTVMSVAAQTMVAWMDGDFEQALRVLRALPRPDTGGLAMDYMEMDLLALLNRPGDAIGRWNERDRQKGAESHLMQLGHFLVHALRQERHSALALLDAEFLATSRSDLQYSVEVANGMALLGERDAALQWLQHAMDRGFLAHQYISQHDRMLTSLREDARFGHLVQEMRTRSAALPTA